MTPAVLALLLGSAPAPPVENRPLRVLLAAGAPTREYQFVRSLLVREVDRNRAELSIYLQGVRAGNVVQDVPPDRLLRQFPEFLRAADDAGEKPPGRHLNLARYDVIIACDLDWTQLTAEQLVLLERWVDRLGGGLILVGGPLNTFHLVRPANREKLKPLLDLCPVVLEDHRLKDEQRAATDPRRLGFRGAPAEMSFLRLDPEHREPMTGWDDFFGGPARKGEKAPPQRGFYNYYPVKQVKGAATVVATFTDPAARLAGDREHPFLVVMPYGKGRVVWLGSGEMWRLRQYRADYYDRFWTNLARYAASQPGAEREQRGALLFDRKLAADGSAVAARLLCRAFR